MTIYELALGHLRSHGVSEQDATVILEEFGAAAGKDIGWADIAPRLSRPVVERLDRAAVGWMMAHRHAVCATAGEA